MQFTSTNNCIKLSISCPTIITGLAGFRGLFLTVSKYSFGTISLIISGHLKTDGHKNGML